MKKLQFLAASSVKEPEEDRLIGIPGRLDFSQMGSTHKTKLNDGFPKISSFLPTILKTCCCRSLLIS